MIPEIPCARMIQNSMHGPLEQAYAKVLADHDREVRLGTIQTLMGIFRTRAIQAERDEIYLFDHYRFV